MFSTFPMLHPVVLPQFLFGVRSPRSLHPRHPLYLETTRDSGWTATVPPFAGRGRRPRNTGHASAAASSITPLLDLPRQCQPPASSGFRRDAISSVRSDSRAALSALEVRCLNPHGATAPCRSHFGGNEIVTCVTISTGAPFNSVGW